MIRYVYIACPYTQGDQALNVRDCVYAANSLMHEGYIPFAPLLYHFWHMITPHEYGFWTDLDMAWVKKCDAVRRLPGPSAGADAEVREAKIYGIPTFHSILDLVNARSSKT